MNDLAHSGWLSQVDAARTTSELLRVLREYLTSLTPEQRAVLPAACNAHNLTTAAEIQEWAVTLAHDDLKRSSGSDASDTLHRAAIVFAAAGARLPRISEG